VEDARMETHIEKKRMALNLEATDLVFIYNYEVSELKSIYL